MKQSVKMFMSTVFAEIKTVILQMWWTAASPEYRLIKRSGLFDMGYYLYKSPDLAGTVPDLLGHYVRRGGGELRHASIFFDPHYYLSQLSSGARNKINPLVHFLKEGWLQGKRPNPGFCTDYYLDNHPGVRTLKINPLVYYIDQGWKLGHCTSPEMEVLAEKISLFELIEGGINPLASFLDRKPYPCFNSCWYLDQTPSLTQVTNNH